MIGLPGRLKV